MLESRKWQGLWEKKIQAVGRGAERGCTVGGEEKKNQKGLFGLILAGRRTNKPEGGAAGGTSWERKKIRAGGGGGPLGEDKLRSFLGFFLFCVVSS
jgi:hypothetical protein